MESLNKRLGKLMPRHLSLYELENFPSLDWFDVAPTLTPAVRTSLERILETQNGNTISLEDACTLAHVDGDDLLGLLPQPTCCASNFRATWSPTSSIATLTSPISVLSDANSAPSAAGPGNPILTFLSQLKSRKKQSRPGRSERERSASRADCRTACLRFIIATFCAR